MENKTAQAVLALIILMVLLAIIVAVKNATEGAAETKSCEASVKAHTDLIKLGIPARHNEINCPAKRIKVTEKNANFELAEAMRKCWKQYGKGRLNMFNGEGVFCSVCKIITSDKPIVVGEFTEYLADSYVPGESYKYLDDFQDFETERAEVLEDYEKAVKRDSAIDDFTISEQQPYGVIFVQIKGYDNYNRVLKHVRNLLAGGAVMTFGTMTWKGANTLHIVPVVGTKAALVVKTIGAGIITVGVAGTWAAEYFVELEFERYSEVLLRPYTEKTLNETIECDYIPVRVMEK